MAVDPNISLKLQTPDTATPINEYATQQRANQQQENSNRLSAETTLKAHYEAMDAREKSRLSSSVIGAAQLKTRLDNNDLEGAENLIMTRLKNLQTRMAQGENIDTQETDYALQMLREGKIDQLKNDVNGLMAAGQVYGIIKPPGENTYIDQFKVVKQAHPGWSDAQVQDYVYTRGNVGKGTVFNDQGQVVNQPGAVDASAEKKGAEQFATEAGGGAGKQLRANEVTIGNLANMSQAVAAAKATLPKVSSTGPIFGRTGDAAREVEYVNLQRDISEITLLAKELYNLGSGQGFTDADRDFLQELSGGRYNREESIQYALDRFEQTIARRNQSLQGQNQGYRQEYPQGGTAQPGAAPGNKIKITNGKEIGMIDPADLPEAMKEGFQQVQ